MGGGGIGQLLWPVRLTFGRLLEQLGGFAKVRLGLQRLIEARDS